MAPPAARRVSRHKKRYWRKGTNVADIEAHLDEVRADERLVGRNFSSQSSSELFFIEKERPDEGNAGEDGLSAQLAPRGRTRKAVLLDELKCFKSLKNTSRVDAMIPTTQPAGPKTKSNRQNKGHVLKRQSSEGLAREDEERRRTRSRQEAGMAGPYDLWNVGGATPSSAGIGKRAIRAEKTSALPAIDVAHPGASYNPSLADYEELLHKAASIEADKLRADEKLARKLALPANVATEESRAREMAEGLFGTVKDEPDDEDEAADEACVGAPVVRREAKKLRSQRRKEQAKEEALRLKKAQIAERKRLNEVFRVRSLTKELKAEEAKVAERTSQRAAHRLQKRLTGTAKLSKLGFEPPALEVSLPDELAGSLRRIEPEGNLLQDRFKSLQRRNVIETRVRQKRVRKYKRKKFETKAYKEVTVAYRPK